MREELSGGAGLVPSLNEGDTMADGAGSDVGIGDGDENSLWAGGYI